MSGYVVKNEELPLNANNHCRQAFDLIRMAIVGYYHWQPVNSLQSIATAESPHLDPNRFSSGETMAMTGSTPSPMMN